jgi:malonyl-CoA O-methyltransferase
VNGAAVKSPSVPLALLHGWGFSSRVWQPLITELHRQCNGDVFAEIFAIDLPGFGTAYHEPCGTLEQTLQYIVEQLPARCILCGWSLGGMLAAQMAARFPDRIAGLITLGSNVHFTATENWQGMPVQDYEEFCRRFAQQPEKTWRRFLQLQTRGDSNSAAAEVLEQLASFSDLHTESACNALSLLGAMDNRAVFRDITQPGLHLLGEYDSVTPPGIQQPMQMLNARQTVEIMPDCGHAMLVSQPAITARRINKFLHFLPYLLKKRSIGESFSRAASTYDAAAHLQRTVADKLINFFPARKIARVLDIGCGTGFVTQQLLELSDQVIAADLAYGMLNAAQKKSAASIYWLQADMENLPLMSGSIDVAISSLALQWSQHLSRTFTEWHRVLQPDGTLIFSTFLPGTLHEMEDCWRQIDSHVHVNRFASAEELAGALQNCGFSDIQWHKQACVSHYETLTSLARELKSIGAHNMNVGQARGLTGKSRWATLQKHYEQYRDSRGLPATYEMLYVIAQK